MALNEKFRYGDHVSLPVPAGTAPGSPVLVGALPGVTQTAVGEGGNPAGHATVWLTGVFDLTVGDEIGTVGKAVYITAAGALTNAASGNTLFGYALATKAAAAGAIPVKIARV